MMLAQRYPAQNLDIKVINDGSQGETAVDGAGRLDSDLSLYRPDVLLLQEGVNDIDHTGSASSIPPAIDALRTMIRDAKGRGIES